MIGVVLLAQAYLIWVVCRSRRELQERVLVWEAGKAAGLAEPTGAPARPGFPGAVPPSRYVVVRWPDGHHFYSGCSGAEGRRMYEHTPPGKGETVEFWELGSRRGYKVG